MEILYHIDCAAWLIKPENPASAEIRPIACPGDYDQWLAMFRDRNPNYTITLADWCKWISAESTECIYYGAFVSGRMVSIASIEKYSPDRWETAAVRTLISERGNGYAKLLCYEVTKKILESGKTATARTEADNFPMQRVLAALGFVEI